MGDRVYTAPENAGGLVTNFVEYGGRIWAASGDYLCRLSEDCTSWDKEILCPTPIKLLVVVKQPHYRLIMTSAEEGNTALYELNASETGITMVCLSLGDEETRVTSIAALHVISEFNSDEEWVDAVYAVFSERAMVARWGWQEGRPVWYVTINYDAVGFSHYSSCTALRYDFPSVTTIYIAGSDGNYYHISGMGGEWERIADGSTTEYPNPEDSLWVHHRDRIYLCDYYGRLYLLRTTLTGWDLAHESPPEYYHPKNIISYAGYLFLVTGDSSGDYEDESQMYILKDDGYFLSWYYAPKGLRPSIIYNGKLYYSSIYNSNIMRYISLNNLVINADTYNGEEPLTVNFSMGADSDFTIVSYHLHFDDDTAYHGLTTEVTHEYIRGTYSPSLRVSNGLDELTWQEGDMIDAYDSTQIYQIYTIEDLQKIGLPGNKTLGIKAWPLHGYYEIMNDIDASETSSWNEGHGFDPRSKYYYYNSFTGTLEGNNHTISDLYINTITSDGGIFCSTNACIIRNLTVENATIISTGSSGVLAANLSMNDYTWSNPSTSIENCSIIGGSVAGSYGLGGIAGYAYNTSFSNCYSSVNFVTTNAFYVGGIAGRAGNGASFENCVYENNSIQDLGTSYSTGGLVGDVYFDVKNYIINCTITANFIVRDRSGMLTANLGCTNGCLVSDCTTHGSLKALQVGYYFGAFISQCYGAELTNCHNYATFELSQDIDGSYFGGFIGYFSSGSCMNCTSYADVLFGNNHGGNSYTGGFVGYSSLVNYEDCHNFGNSRFNGFSAGGFVGGHSGGNLINCSVRGNVEIPSGSNVGGFGGYIGAWDPILNCYTTGDFISNGNSIRYVGGFIGYIYGDIVEGCYTTGNMIINSNSIGYVGGLIGDCNLNLKNCYTTGNIECYSPTNNITYVGGLCGSSDELVEGCYTTGNVKSNGNKIGGLIGTSSSTITKCYASGSVEGYSNVGGFIGYHYEGRISDCYAQGDVNSLITGGSNSTGGFIGYTEGSEYNIIERVYSCGKVTALTGEIGGLIGQSGYTLFVYDSYWDIETSGLITSAGGTGRDTATMKTFANYPDWDFAYVWIMLEGETYPLFEYPKPPRVPLHVQFIGNPLSGFLPLQVTFTDQSTW